MIRTVLQKALKFDLLAYPMLYLSFCTLQMEERTLVKPGLNEHESLYELTAE